MKIKQQLAAKSNGLQIAQKTNSQYRRLVLNQKQTVKIQQSVAVQQPFKYPINRQQGQAERIQGVNNSTQSANEKQNKKLQGSLLGAVGLVTGSSVGAGILALPTVAVDEGFGPTATLLFGSWVYLTLQAYLIAEVNINIQGMKSQGSQSSFLSLADMAKESLGPSGSALTKVVYTLLATTLITAYTAKAGDVFAGLTHHSVPNLTGSIGFVGLLTACLYGITTQKQEKVSSISTFIMLGMFALVVVGGLGNINMSHLLAYQDLSEVSLGVPVIFLSLVYHDLIPVLVHYLGGDKGRVRQAITIGSFVTLNLFLLFVAVALGTVDKLNMDVHLGLTNEILDPLKAMSLFNPACQVIIPLFALSAVFASSFGCCLGFSKFMQQQLQDVLNKIPTSLPNQIVSLVRDIPQSSSDGDVRTATSSVATANQENARKRQSSNQSVVKSEQISLKSYLYEQRLRKVFKPVANVLNKVKTNKQVKDGDVKVVDTAEPISALQLPALALIFVPAVTISAANPELFFKATQIAGAYGMMLMYGVLPPIMAFRMRKKVAKQGQSAVTTMVPGGIPILGALSLIAGSVGLNQATIDLGLFSDAASTVTSVPLV